MALPLTFTVAPMIGSPFTSTILPVILLCAIAIVEEIASNARTVSLRILFFIILLVVRFNNTHINMLEKIVSRLV
jgi:hypothetical protein